MEKLVSSGFSVLLGGDGQAGSVACSRFHCRFFLCFIFVTIFISTSVLSIDCKWQRSNVTINISDTFLVFGVAALDSSFLLNKRHELMSNSVVCEYYSRCQICNIRCETNVLSS